MKTSTRVKTIVNNSAADSHIFLLRHIAAAVQTYKVENKQQRKKNLTYDRKTNFKNLFTKLKEEKLIKN